MGGFRTVFLQDRRKALRLAVALLATLAIAVSLSVPGAHAQNDKKKKKNEPPKVNNDNANPVVPLTDEQQIDYMLSEYLAVWQLGDAERMHKFYSEDVSVVNGGWAAPVVGWTNFLALYQQQKSHMQRVRLDRMNTYIKVNGTTAWACYQWEFEGLVDGTLTLAHGQTTLVLVKRDTRWLIAHDHTSVVDSRKEGQPGSAPSGGRPASTPSPQDKPQA
jgi:ketosteroid isomerase-like protein